MSQNYVGLTPERSTVDFRRAIAAASIVAGLLAAAPADAGPTYQLDGRKKQTVSYSSELVESSIRPDALTREEPMSASRSDCSAASCDLRAVVLTSATGGKSGRLKVTVRFDRLLEAALVVYNAKGEVVASDDVLDPTGSHQQNCCEELTYQLEISRERWPRGRYTIAVMDRVGVGQFYATVDWFAHPKDRVIS